MNLLGTRTILQAGMSKAMQMLSREAHSFALTVTPQGSMVVPRAVSSYPLCLPLPPFLLGLQLRLCGVLAGSA